MHTSEISLDTESSSTAIVVPCFNEQERFDADAFSNFIASSNDIRFHFVNDGSTDDTGRVLERMAAAHPARVGVRQLSHNVGKAEAVRLGFLDLLEGAVDFLGYWDADLATPLETIESFQAVLTSRPELQAVFGARVQLLGRSIERSVLRHYAGRIFATVVSGVLDLKVYDTQCGAKLFRVSDTLREIFRQPFQSKWIFDVELLARLMALGAAKGNPDIAGAVYEFPLSEWRDVRGSNIRLRDFVLATRDLAKIYCTLKRR